MSKNVLTRIFVLVLLLVFVLIEPLGIKALADEETSVLPNTKAKMVDSGADDRYCIYQSPTSTSKIIKTCKNGDSLVVDKRTTNSAGNVWYHVTKAVNTKINGWVWSGTVEVVSDWVANGDSNSDININDAYGSKGVKMEYSSRSFAQKFIDFTYKDTKYRTVMIPTRYRYRICVKDLSASYYPSDITELKTTTTQSTDATLNAEVFTGLSALGVNVGAKVGVSYKTGSSDSTTATTNLSKLNPKYRYKWCYWIDTVEYNATTYKYNTTTKNYDIRVDNLGGKNVSGKVQVVHSKSLTAKLMWGY